MVDKELALLEWAKGNPFLTDRLLFDFLGGSNGGRSISPLAEDATVKSYVDGTAVKRYTFALQVMFEVSDAADNTNTENMFTMRKWQNWIEEQEEIGNYPDFGAKCSDYRLENLGNMPAMALLYENNMAKYQFFARLTYLEKEK